VTDLEAEVADIETRDLALDGVPVADEDHRRAELAHRVCRALDDHGRAVIAPMASTAIFSYEPSVATISRPL